MSFLISIRNPERESERETEKIVVTLNKIRQKDKDHPITRYITGVVCKKYTAQ